MLEPLLPSQASPPRDCRGRHLKRPHHPLRRGVLRGVPYWVGLERPMGRRRPSNADRAPLQRTDRAAQPKRTTGAKPPPSGLFMRIGSVLLPAELPVSRKSTSTGLVAGAHAGDAGQALIRSRPQRYPRRSGRPRSRRPRLPRSRLMTCACAGSERRRSRAPGRRCWRPPRGPGTRDSSNAPGMRTQDS